MPALSTTAPALRTPAAMVAAIHWLDSRVSRPRMTFGFEAALRTEWPRARPAAKIVFASRGATPATPRIPSVPKSLRSVDVLIVSLSGFARSLGLRHASFDHTAVKRAIAQAGSDQVAHCQLSCRTNHDAISILDQGI